MESDHSARAHGSSRLAHGELTGKLLRIFFDVYNELGSGFLESVYSQAYAQVMREEGIPFEREAFLTVLFRGKPVGVCKLDFVVAGVVVIECKAVSSLASIHRGQLLHYLRATGLEVGLLLNFGPAPEFKRIISSRPLRASQ
jgi:GxxExxY protein